jgi:hypothetical protein
MEGPCGTGERQWTDRRDECCVRRDKTSVGGDEPTRV